MVKKTVGFYGGKFLPIPHLGHVYAMTVASTMVDELHVIISYDEVYEKKIFYKNSKMKYVSHKQRLRWWKQITKDIPHVHIHLVYEHQTGEFSDWENGAVKIREAVGQEIDYVFSSEHSYDNYFNKLYPEAKHILIDPERKRHPISGTKIRATGIFRNWDYIPEVVKPYFTKKVAIVGTESSGKSTLVNNLANIYNTNHVEEIGRTFYERIGSYETLETDFPEIAYEHQHRVKEALRDSNKLLFIDTEAIVTQNFLRAYENKHMPVLDEIAKLQNYDLWLFLEPDVKWVDDGTRTFGSIREDMTKSLKAMLKVHGVEYKSISGDYPERLNMVIAYVDNLMKEGK